MNKKVITIIIIAIGLLAIGGMLYASYKMNQEQKKLDARLIELHYDTLKEKIDNQDSFILVLTATDCSHCAQYKPILKKVLLEYNLYAYEIQTDKLTNSEEKAYLNSIATINGTPTTIFIENGQEKSTLNRLVGSRTRDDIIARLKNLGYIE